MMNPELKTKWLAALRSRKYKQGHEYLKRVSAGVTRHCCLGVLAEVSGKAHWDPPLTSDMTVTTMAIGSQKLVVGSENAAGVLPCLFRDECGITALEQDLLWNMNDGRGAFIGNKHKFYQIAKWIEKNL